MPFTVIVFGALLVLTGVVGYIHGVMNDKASLTAFIPAAFGLVIAILGFAANAKESLRKHLMHGAIVVALLGFLIPTGRLASKFSELTLSAAVVSQVVMGLLCLVFVLLCVRSFIAARRNSAD